SALYEKIFRGRPDMGKWLRWDGTIVPEWEDMRRTSRRALREGRPGYEQEFHIRTPDGTLCVQERVSITRVGPERWDMVGVIVDITATRAAELALAAEKERLAVTLGSMNEGVVTVDGEGRIVFINRAAADLVQWEAQQCVGRDLLDVCVLQGSDGV